MTAARPSQLRLALDQWAAEREGPAGLERRRDRRLQALVAAARAGSPFYRRLYGGPPHATPRLPDLPPVTKPELMADFDDWVTDRAVTLAGLEAFIADPDRIGVPYLGRYFVGTSSGTSGHRGVFVHDERAFAVYCSSMYRIDRTWLSAREWLQLARRRGRWAAVVGAGGHFAGAGWMEHQRHRSIWKRHHYRVVPAQAPIGEIVRGLNAFDPAILTGYPSVLEILAAERLAGRLRIRPTIIELGGESVGDAGRARIVAGLGGALHDVYSASELMAMAFDCAAGWLHVNSDWVVLEPVDKQYRPTPPGEPSYTVLLTNLANTVQPLIRYDLGDSVLAAPGPCQCGSPLPAIRVQGRCDDVLRFPDAHGQEVALAPLAIGSVTDDVPGLLRSQLVQTSPRTLRVRLEATPGTDVETVWHAVRSRLADYLAAQDVGEVELVRAEEPPEQSPTSGKFRQVIAAAQPGTPAP